MTNDLRRQITRGDLTPGDKLPPTRVLAETYGLSEQAVYRGVALLKAEGYVRGKRGAGVFVADRRAVISGPLRIKGITRPEEQIVWRHTIRTEAPDWVAEYIGEGECIERARTVRLPDGTIREASASWVHVDLAADVPELDNSEPGRPTWQAMYAERTGTPVDVVATCIDARLATDADREALELDPGIYVVALMRNIYAVAERVVSVGEIVCPPGTPYQLHVS